MSDRARTVVVGYDGSPTARAALTWGAEREVTAARCSWSTRSTCRRTMLGGTTYAARGRRAQGARPQLLASLPDLPACRVESELIGGHAGEAIADVAEARGADEIVVGSRGFSPLRGALGSTSHELLHRASVPGRRDPAGQD